jgi:hypothetical protein
VEVEEEEEEEKTIERIMTLNWGTISKQRLTSLDS